MQNGETNITIISAADLRSIVNNAVTKALRTESELRSKSDRFKWVTNDRAAELLGVSKRQLKYYRDQGYLPYSQLNRKIYFKLADLDNFLNQNYNGKNHE
ncbi:helix-turn-helix domain-containing protein [Gracilimonas tropica]|uniref:helix-turn-helix domain-containing protein n=1 Tax=Gracilimonas tropica TaxID=454600 RepID=UPI00036F589E|nr:helix-turn-helix domain-containing protein [Gracilimonas tropica]